MSKPIRSHVMFAAVLFLAACGGSDSANTTQSSPETAPTIGAGPGSEPSGAASSAESPASLAPVSREVSLPAGTRLPLELLTPVSSETSTVESRVRARLTQDVEVDGVAALPSGTILTGVITEAERAGRVKGLSRVAFRFTEADVRGTPERLRTNALVFVGEESTKGDAARIGGGAVAGAVIGGLLGGGKGAAQGAAVGGAAGTGVVLATRGKDVERAAGTNVTATLAEPLTLQIPR
jgi:hypothetical protein